MKNMHKLLLVLIIFCAIHLTATAQNPTNDLIKQGVAFHNQGKYAEAIDKFNEALKADPDNGYANYEIAYSLYAFKKPNEAIPHLEKADKSTNTELSVAAYVLLASIYDESNQPKKAIEIYNEAIKINPNYPQIYYNLGIAYFRNQQFAEAENSAIEAVKHDPKNASSQRLYALVTFHQNKRANALMGFCSFILLEPTGQRAAEAYANIQHIIQGGALKNPNGGTTITISPKDDKETGSLNLGITLVVQASQSKNLKGVDLLEYQLKSIFTLAGQLSEKKAEKTFFDQFYADYFYKLAQTANMPAFTRVIALTGTKEDAVLAQWLQTTQRTF
jgi:tetratricopeptide (TPR) repeat protein